MNLLSGISRLIVSSQEAARMNVACFPISVYMPVNEKRQIEPSMHANVILNLLIAVPSCEFSCLNTTSQRGSQRRLRKMNGCFNASFGVILFSGLSAKQRSSRSINNASSLVSMSLNPLAADMRRARRSRVGFENASVLIESYVRNISKRP